MPEHIYRACVFNPRENGGLEVLDPGCLVVGEDGLVIELAMEIDSRRYPGAVWHDHRGRILLPGLIDTHTHLSQYAAAGLGDKTLLPWLEQYIFPQEARFARDEVARDEARRFFAECLRHGTTTVVAYVTRHTSAVDIAFAEADRAGVRAFLGKVWMDVNAPTELIEPPDQALRETMDLIDRWHGKGRLRFIVSPRFAVSCSETMLRQAGELARERGLLIQTHLSENRDELVRVARLFPWAETYTHVYARTGCLTDRTLLGHGIHLSPAEIRLVREAGSIITHCPTSNRFLRSGLMPLRKYQEEGIGLTLGTDVAAGYSLSMFAEMREALETSKMVAALTGDKIRALSPAEALGMATLEAARAIGLGDVIGNFAPGKEADFIVVDDARAHPLYDRSGPAPAPASPEERLSRAIYRLPADAVAEVFIAGGCVHRRAEN